MTLISMVLVIVSVVALLYASFLMFLEAAQYPEGFEDSNIDMLILLFLACLFLAIAISIT